MNNRNKILRCRWIAAAMVRMGIKITQGPYIVTELVKRFSPRVLSKKEFLKVTSSVVWNYAKYGFHVDEFFIYDVDGLSDIGKQRLINEETRWNYYAKLNEKKDEFYFDEKIETYKLFKKYFKRELLLINSIDQKQQFENFCSNNNSGIIIKPCDSSGGKGVRLFSENDSIESLLSEYKGGFLMEPRLKNETSFSEFHKESLNTVRIVSVRMDNRVEIAYAFVRLGQNGSCVDNARSGGIIAAIDIETGIIIAAVDKENKPYIIHPNSGKQIIGFRVPFWSELKELVSELAMIVPTTRYVGWDMALTSDGWVLVEGNCKGQFVVQMATKKGLRDQFDSYLKELGVEK